MDGNNQQNFNEEPDKKANLIINYLPQTFTDNDLYKTFINIGPIKTCRVMKDFKTGYSYGFGFVEYMSHDDAARAIQQLNNFPIQHKTLKVSYARPASEDIKDTNVYIQNIPSFYSEEQLEDMFKPYGNVVQKSILKDKITGCSRGIGFIRFNKRDEAQKAIESMNGFDTGTGNRPLLVKLAEDHGRQRGQFAAMGRGMNMNMNMNMAPMGVSPTYPVPASYDNNFEMFKRGGMNAYNAGGKIMGRKFKNGNNAAYNPYMSGAPPPPQTYPGGPQYTNF